MPDHNERTTRDELIACLRRVPFIPFAVTLLDGTVYTVDGVECVSVARDHWAVVGEGGVIRVHSFQAIKDIGAGGWRGAEGWMTAEPASFGSSSIHRRIRSVLA